MLQKSAFFCEGLFKNYKSRSCKRYFRHNKVFSLFWKPIQYLHFCYFRNPAIFLDFFVIKFYFKMNYDIHRQVTDNSLGSHEYRQLRQSWIIPSTLKLSSFDTTLLTSENTQKIEHIQNFKCRDKRNILRIYGTMQYRWMSRLLMILVCLIFENSEWIKTAVWY